jgi:hypothetical protein
MEAESQATGVKYIGLKKTAIWYLIGIAVIFGLSALGVTSDNPSPYYNKMETTPWWSPVRLLFAALFALLIPLPNVLIACLFRSKRNWASILKIFRGWYIGMVIIFIVVGLIGLINRTPNYFCTSVLSIEENQSFLKKFYENDAKFYKGNSIQYGKDAAPYKTYLNCVNTNRSDKCWSELVGTNVRTNREAIEHELSVGVVLHECQLTLKKPQEGTDKSNNTNTFEQSSNTQNGYLREETKPTSELDNILVVYTKETNDQYSGVIIGTEAINLLENNLREGMLKSHAQLLKSKGFTSDAMPEITNSRVSSIDSLGVPVGVATVWLKSTTSEGEMRSKYIYAAGVIGDTLHKVICSQLNGDDITLMVSQKCHSKLTEVFSPKS